MFFKTIRKIVCISIVAAFCISGQLYCKRKYEDTYRDNYSVVDGYTQQVDGLSSAAQTFLSSNNSEDKLDALALNSAVQQEADALGLNLTFNCNKVGESEEYKVSGVNVLTNIEICSIDVSRREGGSYTLTTTLDPNNDGCISNAQDGRLVVAEPIETVFVMQGDHVYEADESYFVTGNQNAYKIKQKPSLWQMVNGPCGYYALYNLLQLYIGQDTCKNILDRGIFEPLFADWKAYIGHEALSNYNAKELIEKKVTELCKSNVIISVSDINAQNIMTEDSIFCFEGTTIDERIQDFQVNGTEQYVLLGTGYTSYVPGKKVHWDNTRGKYDCVENHWLAFKIEWKDASKPGKCPIIITVLDSSGTKDNRYAAAIHWYYQVFTKGIEASVSAAQVV